MSLVALEELRQAWENNQMMYSVSGLSQIVLKDE